jgi:hypothetical protein
MAPDVLQQRARQRRKENAMNETLNGVRQSRITLFFAMVAPLSLLSAACMDAAGETTGAEESAFELTKQPSGGFDIDAADQAALQREVDALVLANPGSVQVSANEVELAQHGARITVPLPGETIARLAGDVVAMGVPNCPYERSCFYEHDQYDGYRLSLYECGFYNLFEIYMPDGDAWSDDITSWHNNQSHNAYSLAYDWQDSWIDVLTANVGSNPNIGAWANDRIDGILNCP